MIAKSFSLFSACFFVLITAYAQEKGDVGIIISSLDKSRLSLEYRKPIGEQYRFKLGALYGANRPFGGDYSRIFSATDSLVVMRYTQIEDYWAGLRIGVERKLKNPICSFGLDLNLIYNNATRQHYNSDFTPNADGEWSGAAAFNTIPFDESTLNSTITRHYLDPSLRISFNIDAPIGDRLLFNFSIAASVNQPIYMGATDVIDPLDDFIGTPSPIINLNSSINGGLRYKLGKIN